MDVKKWELILRFQNGHSVAIPVTFKLGLLLSAELKNDVPEVMCKLKTVDN